MTTGRLITFEGGDGAGKTTQCKRLAAALESRGIRVVLTREVGGAPGAEDIRALWLSKGEGFWDPLTELMLIMAARREHLARTIWPAIADGAWVLSDRFVDSSRAYQGIGLGLGVDKVDAIYREIAGDFWPDLTLFLDVPCATGHNRLQQRGGQMDRYEEKDAAFHEKLRLAFYDLAKESGGRFGIIDAARSEDDVHGAIMDHVMRHFSSDLAKG